MILNLMLVFVPISLGLAYLFNFSPLWVFMTSTLAIIPLAEWIRRATEQMAQKAGTAIGGLLNVTFGNMAELMLALFVLSAGHTETVKGQITGSIIGNSLLGLGLAILIGTWGRDHQSFNRERVGRLSSLLILSVIALLVPALFDYTERGLFASPNASTLDEQLSLGVSIVLILVYIANLVYTLVTHRDEFSTEEIQSPRDWSLWLSMGALLGGTALTALESHLVSSSLESTAGKLGLSTFFLGVVVLAIIGNAAEYVAAIYFAREDHMDIVMGVTAGSSIQVVLLIAPLLVIFSYLFGNPMNLVFINPLELVAVAGVAFVVNAIAEDGETTWFEGVLLVSVYLLLALAFFFATPE